jgi:hypothetical protein
VIMMITSRGALLPIAAPAFCWGSSGGESGCTGLCVPAVEVAQLASEANLTVPPHAEVGEMLLAGRTKQVGVPVARLTPRRCVGLFHGRRYERSARGENELVVAIALAIKLPDHPSVDLGAVEVRKRRHAAPEEMRARERVQYSSQGTGGVD